MVLKDDMQTCIGHIFRFEKYMQLNDFQNHRNVKYEPTIDIFFFTSIVFNSWKFLEFYISCLPVKFHCTMKLSFWDHSINV